MAEKKKATRYRNRLTGRFVSEKTWKRSRAHGGSRFRREVSRRVKRRKASVKRPRAIPKKKRRKLPAPERREREEIEEEEEPEFGGAFDSP
jgi:hypothetical protein